MEKLILVVALLLFTSTAHASQLELRGQGSSAYGTHNLIYDKDLDITWYDFTNARKNWYDQRTWVDQLVVNFGGATFGNWRLPTTVDGVYEYGYDGTTTGGYNVTNSELGHLYYTELENLGFYATDGTKPQPGYGLKKKGYFKNLINSNAASFTTAYWSDTVHDPYNSVWTFYLYDGLQHINSSNTLVNAMAVMDGDVAPVPYIITSPTLYDFGGTNIGDASAPQTFTITNTSNANFTIGTIGITGTDVSEYAIQNDNCSAQIIPPSGNCTLDVVFTPTSEGAKSANLSIPSDASSTSVLNVPLSGTGIDTDNIDDDGDEYTENQGDCNDSDVTVYPTAPELCDGIDNDCNGTVDDGLAIDADGDGHTTPESCSGTKDDCNDNDATVFPTAPELCDGLDNDCDGDIDEDVASMYYNDQDSDNYGNPTDVTQACEQPADYVSDNTDCNDNDANEHPDQTWYKDADDDNYYDGTTDTSSCTRPTGYKVLSELASTSIDCDDNDPLVNHGQTEAPYNGKDDDCDPATKDDDLDGDNDPNATDCDDDDPTRSSLLAETPYNGIDDDCDSSTPDDDLDADGFGIVDDCNDNDNTVYPNASEQCDGKDDDCDGIVDEGLIKVIAKDIIVYLDANGTANITEADVDAGSSGCGAITLSLSTNSIDCSNVGTNTVTLTVMDDNGNSSSDTAKVTVVDNTDPVFTICPADVELECPADTSVAATGTATATDNCSVVSIVPVDVTVGGCGSTKVITRTWTATDSSGNTAACIQTIKVKDTKAPIVTATLVPLEVKKKHGRFRVEYSAMDDCDDAVDLSAVLNGHPVSNGEIVRLHHKKRKCRVKVGLRSDSAVKFECNVFALTVTATDDCGNEGMEAAEHVFDDAGIAGAEVRRRRKKGRSFQKRTNGIAKRLYTTTKEF